MCFYSGIKQLRKELKSLKRRYRKVPPLLSLSLSPVLRSLLLLDLDLGLNAVDLQLQPVVLRLNRLFVPQLSLDSRDVQLQIPASGEVGVRGGGQVENKSAT